MGPAILLVLALYFSISYIILVVLTIVKNYMYKTSEQEPNKRHLIQLSIAILWGWFYWLTHK